MKEKIFSEDETNEEYK